MKFLILCSLIATAVAAPGILGYGGLGLGHGYGLSEISIAAPAIHAAPIAVSAPVLVQQSPAIVKAIAPAATSSVSISSVNIQHPSPAVIKYAAAPAISVAHPIAVSAGPSIISGYGGYGGYGHGGHGIAIH